MNKTEDKQKERITYENEYDKHIADLKIKIIYKFLVDAKVLDVGCGETVDLCELIDCSGHGTCSDESGTAICSCENGY